jgi:hypothetical protein
VAVRPPAAATFSVVNVDNRTATPGNAVSEPAASFARSATDAAGNLTVAFVLSYDDVTPFHSELRLRSRPPGGPFQASVPVTPVDQPNGPVEVAFDANTAGTGILVWRRGQSTTATIEACARPPGGPCGPVQPLATGSVSTPLVSIGPGGHMVAAWRRGLAAADGSFARAGGAFGPPHELAAATQVLIAQEAVAVDTLGHAVVAVDQTGSGTRVTKAIVNDSVAPSVAVTAPAAGQPGESLAFSGNVFDVWSAATSTWNFGDGSTAPGPAATHTYPSPGVFAAALTATDAEGNSVTRATPITIADTVRPRVLSFGMKNRVFAVGPGRTPLVAQRRVKRGTAFRFRLSERGTARITIQRARPGRRARGRCRKPTARLRGRKRCTRWVRVGTLRRRARAGANRVKFSGRLRRKALKLGGHRAVLVITDAAGNRSRPARVRFKVVRR